MEWSKQMPLPEFVELLPHSGSLLCLCVFWVYMKNLGKIWLTVILEIKEEISELKLEMIKIETFSFYLMVYIVGSEMFVFPDARAYC